MELAIHHVDKACLHCGAPEFHIGDNMDRSYNSGIFGIIELVSDHRDY